MTCAPDPKDIIQTGGIPQCNHWRSLYKYFAIIEESASDTFKSDHQETMDNARRLFDELVDAAMSAAQANVSRAVQTLSKLLSDAISSDQQSIGNITHCSSASRSESRRILSV